MPGICVLVGDPRDATLRPDCERMLQRMNHYSWFTTIRFDGQGVAMGAVSLDSSLASLWEDPATDTTLIVEGELYDADVERRQLQAAGVVFRTAGDAELLLKGWQHEGDAFLRRVHGLFTAACWSNRDRRLTLFTDRFGLKPLYSARAAGRFAAASEIKSFFAIPGVSRGWSDPGLAQFFTFGHFFNNDTLFAAIKSLPCGTSLTYRADQDAVETREYWSPRPSRENHSTADLIDALDAGLVSAVARRARPGEALGISLSGGMDARTILGLLPASRDITSVSIGIDGSIDHDSASRLAALADVPHHRYFLDDEFLGCFEHHLCEMVRLTDGHYLDQGIVVPTLTRYRELGIKYLLRGHGGELCHMNKAYAFSLDDEAMRASDEQLEEWLFAHLSGYMIAEAGPGIFSRDLEECARASLRQAYADAAAFDPPVQRVWQLFLTQRLHRETALSMHKFGCFANVRMPFIDNQVVDALLAIPPDVKRGDNLQCEILQRRRPDFLDVTNSNTGAPPGAGKIRTGVSRLRLRVYSRLGVRGYQPYERLGLWLGRELRPLLNNILLSDEFLSRGLCDADRVRKLIDDHALRQTNNTFLLMSLLIFELGQRMLVEPDKFGESASRAGADGVTAQQSRIASL